MFHVEHITPPHIKYIMLEGVVTSHTQGPSQPNESPLPPLNAVLLFLTV